MRVRIIEPTKQSSITKKKVCAYVRVSSDSEKQGESFENQTTYYETLISSNPEYEFVGVFADRGITGTVDNRQQFQEMIERCRNGQIDIILTKSISRFARNTVVMLETIRELKNLNVEVRFEKENINTMSGDGEFMLTVLSSFAQEESKNVSDNLKWRVRRNFEQGKILINTSRFLGYDKDQYGDLVINQREAEIVKRIYDVYLKGNGCFKIAKMLNEEMIPSVTGGKWHESTILGILKNEKYKGDAILQKTYSKDHITKKKVRNKGELDMFYIHDNHSPIIYEEIWDMVQDEIKIRGHSKGNTGERSTKYQNKYPLTGMLFCSKCGSVLRRRTWNSKHSCRKIVWQCSNYILNGKAACEGTKIDDSELKNVNIQGETIVKESFIDGKKHYSYTLKGKHYIPRSTGNNKKESGSVLQSVDRPIRTVIKL